jgi:para-aminobenzoate synthetase/4-amino-4-deoxychorismate lyase
VERVSSTARFDDLISHRGRRFTGLQREIIATDAASVVAAMDEVEAEVASGAWAAGYVAYEAAPALAGLPTRSLRSDDPFTELPLVWFGIFSGVEDAPIPEPRTARPAPYHVSVWTPTIDRTDHQLAVARIHDLIRAGETYQVNYTFRLRSSFSGESDALYADLAWAQGGAYGAFLTTGRFDIVSASPELFFVVDDGVISTQPMKGTMRRGRWPEEDLRFAEALKASEKERAENLMIVDLLRNDLGRIAVTGSVEVDALFDVERYETVWQMTSRINARLRDEVTVADIFGAMFPCGSVTGTPKARTMEIIAELEQTGRGVYCGAIGYLAPPGAPGPQARFSVGIRTVVIDHEEGLAEYGVGGAVTWDSEPASEFEEARAKAAFLEMRRPEFDLLETLRFDPGTGYLWVEEHLDRMGESAAYFGFPWDRDAAFAALESAAAGLSVPTRVRFTWSRTGKAAIESTPLGPVDPDPLPLVVCTHPVSSRDVFLFHKTTNRRVYELRRDRYPDVSEVLMINERGEVTEATEWNVLVELDGEWWTPPLESGCLPGVHRRMLLEQGEVRERVLRPDDLARAGEIVLVNSVRGRRAAVLSDGGAAPGSLPA